MPDPATRKTQPADKQKRPGATRRLLRSTQLRPREISLMIVLIILMGLFEGVGIGLLLPILQFIEDGVSAIEGASGISGAIYGAAEKLNIPITLTSLLVIAFIPIILRGVTYFFNQWYVAILQKRAAQKLRVQGFGALVHGDLGFVTGERQGDLVNIFTSQIYRGGTAILQFIQMSGAIVIISVYMLILAALSLPLAGITVVAVAAIFWLTHGNIARSRAAGRDVTRTSGEMFTVIAERIGAIRLIKMRGQEDVETENVRVTSNHFEQAQIRIQLARAAVEVTVDPALMLAVFAILYVGVEFLHASLAELGLFMFILLRLNQQAKSLTVARQMMTSNVDGLESVLRTIDRAKESRIVVGGDREFSGLQEAVTFDDVSFSYTTIDGECTEVLKHVSLSIPSGSMTAFVGRSGAGKSTLVDLIPHLREVSGGQILLDGVPLREFELHSLRRHIGFMTQEAMLFNDTLRYNLVYGLENEVTDEQISAALDAAYCGFVSDLPEGLETVAGDRGVRLSGGQRQRIALARVFLADPDIIILDEPTSALDSESELYIQKALDRYRASKTLIVIAHRLSTVQRADTIFVIEDGEVAESGSHDDLLGGTGAYRRLFELQTKL